MPPRTRPTFFCPDPLTIISFMQLAVAYKSQQPTLVRAQSSAGEATKKRSLVRRHSSGDHAFLPTRQDREAIKQANKVGKRRRGRGSNPKEPHVLFFLTPTLFPLTLCAVVRVPENLVQDSQATGCRRPGGTKRRAGVQD